MQEIDGESYLTVEEATAMLGVKRATLYAYVSRGVLGSFRMGVGRQRLYKLAEIEGLLKVRADAPSPRQLAETPAPYSADDTMRNVSLPSVDTWAGDH